MAPCPACGRVCVDGLFNADECLELIALHDSHRTTGFISSYTIAGPAQFMADGAVHGLMRFVDARERCRELLEDEYGLLGEVHPEMTALGGWYTGSELHWHTDDNRDYLKQRQYSLICFLDDAGADFSGGGFEFEDGCESCSCGPAITPKPGRCIVFSSLSAGAGHHQSSPNKHCVRPVLSGSRHTLFAWFTLDHGFSEDRKLLPSFTNLPAPMEPIPEQVALVKDAINRLISESEGRHPDCVAPLNAALMDHLCAHAKVGQRARNGCPHSAVLALVAYAKWQGALSALADCTDKAKEGGGESKDRGADDKSEESILGGGLDKVISSFASYCKKHERRFEESTHTWSKMGSIFGQS